jgi:hypothetical protein
MWVDALPIGSSSLFVLLVVLVVVFYDANWVSTFVVILCNKVTNTNHNHRERERERDCSASTTSGIQYGSVVWLQSDCSQILASHIYLAVALMMQVVVCRLALLVSCLFYPRGSEWVNGQDEMLTKVSESRIARMGAKLHLLY